MNRKPPQLRRHATGQWFCRWGARDHYFGHDREAAEAAYLESLRGWADWRAQRDTRRLPPLVRVALVAEIAEQFLDWKESQGGAQLRRYYTNQLGRFLRSFGAARADAIRPTHLHALKQTMMQAKYAAKTVNHDLIAVKAMMQWAVDLDYIPAVSFRGVKTLPLGPPPDKSRDLKWVRGFVRRSPKHVKPWLAINYLCLMRPSEVVRVVHRQGQWSEKGVFRLDRGKIDLKARLARHVVFSPEALGWLEKCEPIWSRLDSYSNAVRDSCNAGPGILRHSAATHLLLRGVDRAEISLLLGHAPPRVSLTYARIVWQPLRRTAARLTLR